MKYKPEDYIIQDTMYYGFDNTEIDNYKEKLVKCRKPHKCNCCEKEIKPGEHAIRESGFMEGKPVSCYTCTDCMDEWFVNTKALYEKLTGERFDYKEVCEKYLP